MQECYERMADNERQPIIDWTVDYGEGREPFHVTLPHAWRQDVPVTYEGPATYRTTLIVPRGRAYLHFDRVSYAAEIYLNGDHVATHHGLWDAFDVQIDDYCGKHVVLEVKVTKNGGKQFPVKDVASGFLPFVFHTFGGIYGTVELCRGVPPPPPPPCDPSLRYRVEGRRLYVDGKPFYVRGLLTWGWYPEVGHPNPPEDVIRREVQAAKSVGFNLVKFCLWLPSHRYLEILREEGLEAWIELPLWDPTEDAKKQRAIAGEIERIVRQYRHHDNILVWTVGCELSTSTSAAYRQELTQLVKNLTRSPLVKDNSGGAEMYGGDLREFGDFYDFHPYCETNYYPAVLDSLLPGPRREMPILLGEFNDIDVHRDIAKLGNEIPYWCSTLPELNDRGVRWQYELPDVVQENRFSLHPIRDRHAQLMESSRRKALFMRKTVQEAVRARDAIAGYVITGWRDTPISSSGFVDDWDRLRFRPIECDHWNGPIVLFTIPTRRPPWIQGGNRPGYLDMWNFFTGQLFWRIGLHSETELEGGLVWKLQTWDGDVFASGSEPFVRVPALTAREVAQISIDCDAPGDYILEVEFAGQRNAWPIWVVPQPDVRRVAGWRIDDPMGLLPGVQGSGDNVIATTVRRDLTDVLESGGKAIVFLHNEGTVPCPFWREAAYEFKNDEFWSKVPFKERWERLLPLTPDRAVDPAWLAKFGEPEVLMNRIDTRTYRELPIVARAGNLLVTTLRPFGGLGMTPGSLSRNPAGVALLECLVSAMQASP